MKLVAYKYENNTDIIAPQIVNKQQWRELGLANYKEIDFTHEFNVFIEFVDKYNYLEEFNKSFELLKSILSGQKHDILLSVYHLVGYGREIEIPRTQLLDLLIQKVYIEFGVND